MGKSDSQDMSSTADSHPASTNAPTSPEYWSPFAPDHPPPKLEGDPMPSLSVTNGGGAGSDSNAGLKVSQMPGRVSVVSGRELSIAETAAQRLTLLEYSNVLEQLKELKAPKPFSAQVKELLTTLVSCITTSIPAALISFGVAVTVCCLAVDGAKRALQYTERIRVTENYYLFPEFTFNGRAVVDVFDFLDGKNSVDAPSMPLTEPDNPGGLWGFTIVRSVLLGFCTATPVISTIVVYIRKGNFWDMMNDFRRGGRLGFLTIVLPCSICLCGISLYMRGMPILAGEIPFFSNEDKSPDHLHFILNLIRAMEFAGFFGYMFYCYLNVKHLQKMTWVFQGALFPIVMLVTYVTCFDLLLVPLFRSFSGDAERVIFRLFGWPLVQLVFVGISAVIVERVPGTVIESEARMLSVVPSILMLSFAGRFLLANVESSEWMIAANVGLMLQEILIRCSAHGRDVVYDKYLHRYLKDSPLRSVISANWTVEFRCYVLCVDMVMEYVNILAAGAMVYALNLAVDPNSPPIALGAIVANGAIQFVTEVITDSVCLIAEGIYMKMPIAEVWAERPPILWVVVTLQALCLMCYTQHNVISLFCMTLTADLSSVVTMYCK